MNKPKIEKPKVFISYAWTSDSYINKVASFASSLMNLGIDVLFDKFEMKPGNELNNFMEKSVKDSSVTSVLLLLNKAYKEKADNREGGVGKETQILSEELYNNVNQTKIIPVIFEKGSNGEIYKPTYIGSTYHIDLADENKYESEFKLLVKSIYGETIYRKPELGTTPSWVTEEIVFEPKTELQLSSFKNQLNKDVNDQNYISLLSEIKTKILLYKITNISTSDPKVFSEKYLMNYNGLILIRNEYLELVKQWVYVNAPEKKIASFFESTLSEINEISIINDKDIFYILLHEIFIYTIAYFLKCEQYEKVAYILGKTYCSTNYSDRISTFSTFYSGSHHNNLDYAVCNRDNKNYLTGTGNFWIENLQVDFCSQSDFVLADIICFNYSLFGNNQQGLDTHWFPVTYIYGESRINGQNVLRNFAEKLKTKEFLSIVISLFNFNSNDEFLAQFKKIEDKYNDGKLRDYGYSRAFDRAPLLCQYTKSADLGKYR